MKSDITTRHKKPIPPLLPPAAALVYGIFAARYFDFFPYTVSAVCITVVIALLFAGRLSFACRISTLIFLAAGIISFYLYGPGAPSYAGVLAKKGEATVDAVVIKPPQERDGYTVVMLKPCGASEGLRRAGTIRLTLKGTGLDIHYKDVVHGVMSLREPIGLRNPGVFDWGEYARLNGIDAVASASPYDIYRTGNKAWPLLRKVYAFRERLIRKAESSMSGPSGSLFRAVILGDQGGIDEKMRDAFGASGTTHILSVSGSHIALLSGFVFFVIWAAFKILPPGWALRLSMRLDINKAAAWLAIPACIGYCLIAGSEVATVRSTIMVCVFLASVIMDRQNQVLNTLSAAAIVLLLPDPSALFDISFRLSFMAVLFIALALEWMKGLPKSTTLPVWARGTAGKAAAAIVMSLAAVAGTAPLVAGQFNSFSYVTIPANLALMPVTGFLAVPAGLLSILIDALHSGAGLPLAGLVKFSMDAFYETVRFFAAAPSANLHPPSFGLVATAAYFAMLLTGFIWRTSLRIKSPVIALLAVITVATLIHHGKKGTLQVSYLDVGQGDCALARMPDGTTMLIDCGGQPYGRGPGKAAVGPYLWNFGLRRIDYVLVSHPQPDHISGLPYLIDKFDVGQVWEGGLVSGGLTYSALREAISEKDVPRYIAPQGMEAEIGGVEVQVLHNAASDINDLGAALNTRINDRCLVVRLKYKEVSFLFTGDSEKEAQYSMLTSAPLLPLKSDVLKVPHHGSLNACLPRFIEAVLPKVAVISAGRYNRFGHPSPGMVDALKSEGACVYCTAWDGAVTVTTDGHSVEVKTFTSRELKPAHDWEDERDNIIHLVTI
jgi:competence protein ComEC